jgi:glutamyl-tRNA reductase
MPLLALGLNHQTAPIGLREQVAFEAQHLPAALSGLLQEPGVNEAVLLSTCNRTEVYCSVEPGAEARPGQWLARHHQLAPEQLDDYLYQRVDAEAVRHLFRVATGLDSLVLGEPQVLGQVKDAYRHARCNGALKAPSGSAPTPASGPTRCRWRLPRSAWRSRYSPNWTGQPCC